MMLEEVSDEFSVSMADTRVESDVRSRAFSSMVACESCVTPNISRPNQIYYAMTD